MRAYVKLFLMFSQTLSKFSVGVSQELKVFKRGSEGNLLCSSRSYIDIPDINIFCSPHSSCHQNFSEARRESETLLHELLPRGLVGFPVRDWA